MSTINGTSGNDNLNGGSADDLMLAGAGNDMLSGGSGNDAMHGEAGADKLVGGSGNDVLDGGSGSDSLAGDAGNDTLVYTLSDNLPGGALDVYTGGSGTDTVMLQLSDAQWQDPSVRAVLQGYVAFLASVARSGQGEVSNGVASDYVLDFGGGTRLTVQMSEKLSVAVQSSASGAYVTIDHTAALIGGVGTGSTVEAGGVANGNAGTATATGDLSSDDLDGPDDLFQVVAAGTPTAHGYGSYAVSANGVWTFTLNNSHPSVQELNAGATLTETFKVKAVDGSEKLVTVAIGGTNDAAIITGNAGGSVVEAGGVANGSTGTPTVGGNLYADDVDNPDDAFQAVAAGAATASGYGSYGVNAAGQWTYALNDAHAAVQALNVGDSLSDSFTVKSQDGTSQVVTVTIAGRNDAAVISGAGSGAVIEAGGVANGLTATPTAAGDLSADDVDNADDLFQPVPAGTASTSGYGSWGVDAAGQWNYTLDNTHAAVQALNLGQSLSDSFSVTSVDGTTQVVTISIAGRNDAAVITGQSSGAVIEAGGVANGGLGTAATGGNLYAADVDNPNDTFQAVAAGAATAGGYGSYGINAAGQWTYALNDAHAGVQALQIGDSLVDSFTVKSQDGSSQIVTMTIEGRNDAAVISGDTAAAVVEAGGAGNGEGGTPTASGNLLAVDVDNAADAFQAQAAGTSSSGGYGSFSVDTAGQWSFTLANANAQVQALNVGQSLNDSFTVESVDGTTQLITVSIAGRNDAALITGQSDSTVGEAGGVANASAGTATASGNLYADDVDNPDDSFQGVAAGAATAVGYGSYGLTAGGQWNYTLNDAHAAVQALNVGDTLTDSFTVLSADGTAQVVTITVEGRNDAAVITGDSSGAVVEAGSVANGTAGTPSASGDLFADDVDNDDDSFQPVLDGTLSTGAYGRYGVDAGGHWTYVLDDDNAAVQALNADDSLIDSFTVLSIDGTAHEITIDISGRNDAAVITGPDTGPVVESGNNIAAVISGSTSASVVETVDGGIPTVGGDLFADDVDNTDDLFQAVAAGAASAQGYGSYAVAADGEWAFTLNNAHPAVQALNLGDQLVDTFMVKSQDGTSKLVTITIGGRNDAALISGTSVGAVVEAGGVANAVTGTLTAGGDLFADDVDDAHDAFAPVPAGAATLNGYGSFGIDAAGVWTYTLDNSHAAVQALNVGQSLGDSFVVASVDGTAHVVSLSITGRNDAAVISGQSEGAVIEAGGLANGSAGLPTAGGNLYAIDVDNPNDSFQAVAAGATSVNGHGSYCVDAAGKWSFTLDDARAAVQALNVGDALVDRFAVLSIDGTSQTVTITIDGQNDAAAISGDTSGAVVEAGGVANGMAGTATASGDLSADDIDNPDDAFEAVAAGAATVNGYGSFGVDAAGVWTFSLDDSHAAVQALNVGQSLSDSFTVHSADGTAQLVTVSIAGRNDAALITGQSTVAVLEAGGLANASAGAGTVSANGNLYADDIDNPDDAFQAVSAGAATGQGYGSYGLSAGGQWSYALNNAHASVQALNVGDTLTDWFTVLSVDGTAQVVTITIDGRNDAAAISGDTSGAVIEAGGLANGSAGSPEASGDLLAEDVDNLGDAFQPVAAGTATSSGYGRYGVDADGQWRYTLDDSHPSVQALTVGQSLNDTFTVSSVDGTAQVVTVSIAGRNDTALISGDTTGTAVEAGGAANATAGTAASGELYADDLDHPDDVFQAVAPGAASGQGYGSYGVDAGGKWTYTLNDAHAAVQALNVGSTLSDSFTVLSADGTAQEVTVTIEGRNDAAAISGGAAAAVVEAGGAANGTAGTPGATGELFADDVDNDDDSFQPVPAGTLTASGYGRYGVSAGGQWTYLLDDDSPAVQALNTTDTLTDTFTVTTVDGTTKEVTISIAGRNDTALITGKLNGTVAEAGGIDNGSPGSPSATGALLADDVDNPDNAFQALAAGTASAAGYGSYTIDAAGQWTYTLDDLNAAVQALHVGQSLADSFAVLSEDGTVTTVALTIQGANDAPTAGGDAASGNEDTPITTGNVLANDADVDGVLGAGSITAHGQGAHGSVVYNGNGSFTYTPAANYAGSDSFSYTITDEHGATASAVVLMTVNDVIDAPVNTVPAALTVAEDGSKTLTGLAIADADAGSSTLSTTLSVAHGTLSFGSLAGVTLSGNGSASVTLSGTLAALNAALATAPTYVPAANYNGDDTLSMSTSDGALSDSDAVAITVMAVNDAPVAASDVIIMSDGTSGVISVAALLANDSDSDGKALAITAVSTSNLPSVTLNANGSIGITVSNADGSFSYTLDDGAGGITTGTVTVTLKPVTGSGNIVDLSGLSYQASYIDAKNGGDTLTGVAPGDVLIGGDGSDTLKGGNGADTLRGGRDNDTLDGEGGIDLLDLSDATGAITLTLNQGTAAGGAYHSTGALPSSLGTDQYRNMEGVIGGLGNDTLTGSTADDTLIGNGGTDTLHGVNGNDILRGGAANDTLDGGAGIDLLDFSDAGAAVSLILSQGSNGGGNWSTGAQSGLGTDAYKNMEGVKGSVFNDALTGSSGDDVLLGDAGHDLLSGGSGSDVLVGGAGADILTGGAGSDRFAFVGDAASVDQIVDFQTGLGNDVLDVSALLIGYSAGSLAAWIQLRESGNDSIVSVDRDGAGSAYAPQDIAVLQGVVVDLVQLVGSANLDATLDNLWPGA